MNIFRRDPKDAELSRRVKEQREASSAILEHVREVLRRKDELLAEAVNQTGDAMRRKR